MFARMLHPSRRHAHDHERIPQEEETDASNNDSDNIGNAANGNRTAAVNQMQSDQANRTTTNGQPGGGEDGMAVTGSNHDHLAEVAAGGGVDEEEPSQSTATNRNIAIGDNNESSPAAHEHQNSAVDETVEAEEDEAGIALPNPTTHPFLTSQIQTERQLRYRRQSTCTLLILFFLTRLWIEAILKKDLGMIFISLTLSTWTYRWFVCRRETEAEFDRQIVENSTRDAVPNDETGRAALGLGTGADLAVAFDPDLGLMSFQAQMALAILESQRQMLNGGYGNSSSADDGPGVTKEAAEQWKRYTWGIDTAEETHTLAETMTRSSSSAAIKRSTSNDYGSLSSDEGLEKNASPETLEEGGLLKKFEEEPSCSICLCNYEHGEQVLRLPCEHVFHEACLASWTDSHVRCPLCNLDLMDGYEQPPRVRRAQRHAEEQRAFRTVALSTLGRRIRTSRRAANRRASRRAAAEDSIV